MSARISGIMLWLLATLAASAQAQTVVEYVHTDALGSVVAVTNTSRTVLERREYEPYGSQLTPAVSNGPGYTGHVQDAATGLVYMQQRYYDAQIGRFLSVDPVAAREKGDNFNRYGYASNNPYRFADPSGREAVGARWLQQNKAFSAATAKMPGSNAPALAFGGAVLLAPVAIPVVQAAIANPAAVVEAAITAGEMAAGDALGAGTLAATTAALASRAEEIHGALDSIAQRMRTTAVAATEEGISVVGSSERSLSASQKAMLGPNEIAATGPGHAEVTAVNAAKELGLTPTAVGASRQVCDDCQKYLDDRKIEH